MKQEAWCIWGNGREGRTSVLIAENVAGLEVSTVD